MIYVLEMFVWVNSEFTQNFFIQNFLKEKFNGYFLQHC